MNQIRKCGLEKALHTKLAKFTKKADISSSIPIFFVPFVPLRELIHYFLLFLLLFLPKSFYLLQKLRLQRVFVVTARTVDAVTTARTASTALLPITLLKLMPAKPAFHERIPVVSNSWLSRYPLPKAIRLTKTPIALATFQPRSFFIIRNWATQGIKRVNVTAATVN